MLMGLEVATVTFCLINSFDLQVVTGFDPFIMVL